MTLYFYNYNNYANRIYKKEATLQAYGAPVVVIDGVNDFSPGDGINTQHTMNMSVLLQYSPDYMIAVEDGNIVSRWFILDGTYTRRGQYIVSLKRDVLADFDFFKEAPCFIEKATLGDSDPAIFNPESMTFNQIKSDEHPLMDETKSAWLVGYYAKDITSDKLTGTLPKSDVDTAMRIDTTIDKWTYSQYAQTPFVGNITVDYYSLSVRKIIHWFGQPEIIEARVTPFSGARYEVRPNEDYNVLGANTVQVHNDNVTPTQVQDAFFTTLQQRTTTDNLGRAIREDVGASTKADTDDFLKYKDAEIVDTNGAHFKVTISAIDEIEKTEVFMDKDIYGNTVNVIANAVYPDGAWASPLSNYIEKTPLETGNSATPNKCAFGVKYRYKKYIVKIVALTQEDTTYTIAPVDAPDSPCNMITIPYGDIKIKTADADPDTQKPEEVFQMSKEYALKCAMAVQRQMGKTNCYDFQLLPYCPLIGDNNVAIVDADGKLDMTRNPDLVNYITYGSGDAEVKVGVIISVVKRDVTFNIDYELNHSTEPAKVQAMCDMYRLCSPNYSGQFEFSAIKNGGVSSFNVDMTLKPYSPYIHINPKFGWLYGTDYNDARGLICSGDFSIPQLTDAWVEYEVNNKNYQNAFNREIQHMDVMRGIEREQQWLGIGVGAVQGGVTGGFTGASIGGVKGAIAGAAMGTALSALGGIEDYRLSEKAYNENRQWSADRFGMQLENVKALPYSIANVGALNTNNKIFPFIEYYTCTDEEKQALKDKIKYNGMTVGRIGKIIDYIQSEPTYIKGQIIRLDGLTDDYHTASVIMDEIQKGVFI